MARKREVEISTLEQAKKVLSCLPKKPPTSKSLTLALADLKPMIEALLQNSYTRAEVCKHLNELGIPAKEYHLRILLARPRTKR